MNPELIRDTRARAYAPERHRMAHALYRTGRMSYRAIARALGYRSVGGIWKVIHNARSLAPSFTESTVGCGDMTCLRYRGVKVWWNQPNGGGVYELRRTDLPGEIREARTFIEAWGVAEKWVDQCPASGEASEAA